MIAEEATRLIPAPPAAVLDILIRPLDLPAWNPAFVALAGAPIAVVGDSYRLVVRGGLHGTFTYTRIEPNQILVEWDVPGLREQCSWTLQPASIETRVTHTIQRSGPLSVALRGAFHGVADLRLDRLTEVVRGGAGFAK